MGLIKFLIFPVCVFLDAFLSEYQIKQFRKFSARALRALALVRNRPGGERAQKQVNFYPRQKMAM